MLSPWNAFQVHEEVGYQTEEVVKEAAVVPEDRAVRLLKMEEVDIEEVEEEYQYRQE